MDPPRTFEYLRPTTLDEAWRMKQRLPGARWVAGGTDVLVQMRSQHRPPPALISLRRLAGLDRIEVGELATTIGALVPIADIAAHAGLAAHAPVLVQAARRLGSPQVRNAATLGGNLANCSPCADTPPALLVLDARARIIGPGGERVVTIESLFRGPGQTCLSPDELLAEVRIDHPPAGAGMRYLRKGRVAMDLALASVAVLLVKDGPRCVHARVAAGAVGPTPLRLRAVEALLEGSTLDSETLARAKAQAAAEVAPIDDLRASAEYRRALVGALFGRAARAAAQGER